jgi:hypothetical protein
MDSRLTPRRSVGTLARATACLLAWIACANSSSLARIQSSETDDTRIATLRVLDDAVRGLGRVDSEYQQVLRGAIARLPSNSDPRASAQLRTFLARLPPPGATFQCSEDFIRARAEQLLWRLRDVVLGIQTRPVEPSVCYAVPFAVDLTRARTTADVVDIYGYDFDATNLQLVVVTPDGFVDVTPSLVVASHTHLTVRVGENGVPTTTTNQALGLAWGHIIHYRVPLVGPTTHLCSSRLETIPAGRTVYFDGLGTNDRRDVTETAATMRLEYSSNLVQAVLCVTAADPAASGCFSEFLYTTDPDRVIDGVLGPVSSQTTFARGIRSSSIAVRRGLVRQWTAGSRPGGSVTTDAPSIEARLDRIQVVSTDAEACLSPIAYMEAKRTTRVPAATRQRLDVELRRIDRAMLKLRPAFAPP